LLTRNKKTKNITAVATSQVFSVKGKGKKVKVRALDIVPLHETPPQKHSGMAHVLKGSDSFTCTPQVHPQSESAIPAFAFPAIAGTHLSTPEGWKAELAFLVAHLRFQMSYPDSIAIYIYTSLSRRAFIKTAK